MAARAAKTRRRTTTATAAAILAAIPAVTAEAAANHPAAVAGKVERAVPTMVVRVIIIQVVMAAATVREAMTEIIHAMENILKPMHLMFASKGFLKLKERLLMWMQSVLH